MRTRGESNRNYTASARSSLVHVLPIANFRENPPTPVPPLSPPLPPPPPINETINRSYPLMDDFSVRGLISSRSRPLVAFIPRDRCSIDDTTGLEGTELAVKLVGGGVCS